MSTILSFLASLLEKVGLHWLETHKINEAKDAVNKDMALSSRDAQSKLRDKWERKD